MKRVMLLMLTVSLLTVSCCEIKYVTKVQTVYRTPAKLTIPKLPRLSLYTDETSIFTEDNYKKLLKEYSSYIVFTKQLLMLIKEHNKLIEGIKKEEKENGKETKVDENK